MTDNQRPMPAPTTTRTRLDPEARRAQILDCAVRMFNERPYESVSVAAVAQDLGVTRSLVQHYFGGRRDLYLAVLRRASATTPPLVRTDVRDGSIERVAARNIDAWLDLSERNRLMFLATLGGGPQADEEAEAIIDRAREEIVDRILENHTGTTDHPPQVRLAVRGYLGFLERVVNDWLAHGRVARDEVHAVLLKVLLVVMTTVVPQLADSSPGSQPAAAPSTGPMRSDGR